MTMPDEIYDKVAVRLQRARDRGEPVFLLCGNDQLALESVADWIHRARRLGSPAEKISAAREDFGHFHRWAMENETKVPD